MVPCSFLNPLPVARLKIIIAKIGKKEIRERKSLLCFPL